MLRRRGLINNKMQKQLANLDVTAAFVRHVSVPLAARIEADFTAMLMIDDHSLPVCAGDADGTGTNDPEGDSGDESLSRDHAGASGSLDDAGGVSGSRVLRLVVELANRMDVVEARLDSIQGVFIDTVVLVDSTLKEVIALVEGREQASVRHAELGEGAFLNATRAAPGLLLTPPDIPALPFPGGTGKLTEDATRGADTRERRSSGAPA